MNFFKQLISKLLGMVLLWASIAVIAWVAFAYGEFNSTVQQRKAFGEELSKHIEELIQTDRSKQIRTALKFHTQNKHGIEAVAFSQPGKRNVTLGPFKDLWKSSEESNNIARRQEFAVGKDASQGTLKVCYQSIAGSDQKDQVFGYVNQVFPNPWVWSLLASIGSCLSLLAFLLLGGPKNSEAKAKTDGTEAEEAEEDLGARYRTSKSEKKSDESTEDETTESESSGEAPSSGKFKGMSHEFRTPLNAILGYSDVLCNDQRLDTADRKRYFRTIQDCCRDLLDLCDGKSLEQRAPSPQPIELASRIGQLSNLSILVVDDSPTNRELASVYLRKVGCQLDFAENGQEAVTKTASNAYDVVLMDIQMPVTDGLNATREIRESGNRVPIVAWTANVDEISPGECLKTGFSGFLSKPVLREDLYHEILSLVPDRPVQNLQPAVPVQQPVAQAPQPVEMPQPVAPVQTQPVAPIEMPQPAAPAQTQPVAPQLQESVSDPSTWEAVARGAVSAGATLEQPQPPQPQPPQLAPVEADTSWIISTLPMDDIDFVEVAQIFTDSLNSKLHEMVDACSNENFKELAQFGHWLKGAGGSAGFAPLGDTGIELEKAAKAKDHDTCIERAQDVLNLSRRIKVEFTGEPVKA